MFGYKGVLISNALLHKQIDGVAIGSSLGLPFAKALLPYYEKITG